MEAVRLTWPRGDALAKKLAEEMARVFFTVMTAAKTNSVHKEAVAWRALIEGLAQKADAVMLKQTDAYIVENLLRSFALPGESHGKYIVALLAEYVAIARTVRSGSCKDIDECHRVCAALQYYQPNDPPAVFKNLVAGREQKALGGTFQAFVALKQLRSSYAQTEAGPSMRGKQVQSASTPQQRIGEGLVRHRVLLRPREQQEARERRWAGSRRSR
jgi:hypothetical protein